MDKNKLTEFLNKVKAQPMKVNDDPTQLPDEDDTDETTDEQLTEAEIKAIIDAAVGFKESYDNSRCFIKFFNVIDNQIYLDDNFLGLDCVPEFFGICDYEKFLQLLGYKISEVTSCKLFFWGRTKVFHDYYVCNLQTLEKLTEDKQIQNDYQYEIDLKGLYDKFGSADFGLQTVNFADSILLGYASLKINDKVFNIGQLFSRINGDNLDEYTELKNIKKFPISDFGEGYLNINDGNFVSSFTSFKADDFAVPLNIAHYYNVGKGVDGYGTNWRLSLNTCIKIGPQFSDSEVLNFVDEMGEPHKLIEEYYYIEDGAKKFISKSSVSIDVSGNLTYDGKEVKKQQFCGGYTFIPEIKDYVGAELIDQRYSEQAELEDYVKSCELSLKDYVKVNSENGEIVYRISALNKNSYNSLLSGVSESSQYCILTENEALQLQSIYANINQINIQKNQFTLQSSQFDLQKKQMQLQDEQIDQQIDSLNRTIELSKLAEPDDYDKAIDFTAPLSDNDKPTSERLSKINYQMSYISAKESLELINGDVSYSQSKLLEAQNQLLTEQENAADEQEVLLDDQLELLNKQKDCLISQAKARLSALKDAFTKYFSKKAQLDLMLLQVPVNYLKDGNGLVRGFNRDGNLCCIFDSYGNSVAIEHDNAARISAVHDSKGKIMRFKYVGGLLESITDGRGRCVNYGYEDGKLTSVKFADGKTARFSYNNGQLVSVLSGNNVRCTMSFKAVEENYKIINKLARLDNMSKDVTVQKNFESNEELPYVKYLFGVNVVYGDKKVILYYSNKTKEIYSFNNVDKVCSLKRTDETDRETETEYIYGSEPVKTVTQWTRSPLKDIEYLRTEYSDSDKITFRSTNWQKISPTCEQKIQAACSYDEDDRLTNETVTKYTCLNGEISATDTVTNYRYNAQGSLILTESFVKGEELTSGVNYEERTYDDNGNVIKTVSWNSLDSSSKFYTESDRAENGQITADRNEEGEASAEYEYVNGTNVVNSVRYPNGSKTSYGRNPYNFNVTSVTQSTDEGEANTTDIIYEHGLPVEVKSGNTVIEYAYDYKGRKTAVKVNGVLQSSYNYTNFNDNIALNDTFEKADGTFYVDENEVVTSCSEKSAIRDESSNIIKISEKLKINNSDVIVKNYDMKSRLTDLSDYVAQTYTEYTYDEFGNVSKAETAKDENIIFAEDYAYNEYGELAQKSLTGAVTQTYSFVYKNTAAKELDYIEFGNYKFKPLTDVNGRNTGKEIYGGEGKIAAEYISSRKVGDHATNMPATVWFGSGEKIKDSIKYKYDKCGNIIEITENGHIAAKYRYDGLNRLVREDNKKIGKTVLYSYDQCGNITERCEYGYTSKSGEELSELDCTHYSYDYTGDRLMSYNGEEFAYNNIGNPTIYRGKTVQWQYGTRLVNLGNTTFAYDGLGRRIKKGNIDFIYDNDGRLISQSTWLEFFYDANGVAGFVFGDKQYFYRKDAQSNIIAILDNTGAVVVRYIYDAWGNHAIVDANGDDVTEGLGVLNPFRYRSYYYDTETGLYYLQTRYYDPELGRFISQDSLEYADPETINGLNLYAYCGDNPVMRADYSGTSWKSFWNAVGRFIGGVVLTAIGANIALSSFFPAIVNPFATVVCEFGLTIGMYGAALMGSVFNSGIYADMELIGWNPYNNNADMVHKSNTMSFYKGVPVIRYGDFNNGDRSGTFGIMLLARNEEPGAVEHEFGHIPQLMILGILRFGLTVGIPSKNKWGLGTYWNDYYLSPWESMAEIFGGVQNSPSPLTDAERARAIKYLIASYFLGPLVYTFYYKL